MFIFDIMKKYAFALNSSSTFLVVFVFKNIFIVIRCVCVGVLHRTCFMLGIENKEVVRRGQFNYYNTFSRLHFLLWEHSPIELLFQGLINKCLMSIMQRNGWGCESYVHQLDLWTISLMSLRLNMKLWARWDSRHFTLNYKDKCLLA